MSCLISKSADGTALCAHYFESKKENITHLIACYYFMVLPWREESVYIGQDYYLSKCTELLHKCSCVSLWPHNLRKESVPSAHIFTDYQKHVLQRYSLFFSVTELPHLFWQTNIASKEYSHVLYIHIFTDKHTCIQMHMTTYLLSSFCGWLILVRFTVSLRNLFKFYCLFYK